MFHAETFLYSNYGLFFKSVMDNTAPDFLASAISLKEMLTMNFSQGVYYDGIKAIGHY